jgi:hypothetical protein
VITTLSAFVRSWAQLTDDIGAAAAAGGSTPDEAMQSYVGTLLALVGDRFPPELSA